MPIMKDYTNLDSMELATRGFSKYDAWLQHPYFLGRHNSSQFFKKMIFSGPATILFDEDGKKTVVKCSKDDRYDHVKGAMAVICKAIEPNAFKVITRRWKEHPKKEKMALETWLTLRLGEDQFDEVMLMVENCWRLYNFRDAAE